MAHLVQAAGVHPTPANSTLPLQHTAAYVKHPIILIASAACTTLWRIPYWLLRFGPHLHPLHSSSIHKRIFSQFLLLVQHASRAS